MNAYERVMSDMVLHALTWYIIIEVVKMLQQILKRMEEDNG